MGEPIPLSTVYWSRIFTCVEAGCITSITHLRKMTSFFRRGICRRIGNIWLWDIFTNRRRLRAFPMHVMPEVLSVSTKASATTKKVLFWSRLAPRAGVAIRSVCRSGPRLSITWKFSTRTQIYKDYASDIPNTNALLFPTVWCINLANMIRAESPRNFKQFFPIFMTGEKNEKVCSQMISELKERPQTFCAMLLQSLRTIFKNVLLTIQIRRQFWP